MSNTQKNLLITAGYAVSVLLFVFGLIALLFLFQLFDRVIASPNGWWIALATLVATYLLSLGVLYGLHGLRHWLFQRADDAALAKRRIRQIDLWLLPLPILVLYLLHWSAGAAALLAVVATLLYRWSSRHRPAPDGQLLIRDTVLILAIIGSGLGLLHGAALMVGARMTLGGIIVIMTLYAAIAAILGRLPIRSGGDPSVRADEVSGT